MHKSPEISLLDSFVTAGSVSITSVLAAEAVADVAVAGVAEASVIAVLGSAQPKPTRRRSWRFGSQRPNLPGTEALLDCRTADNNR